MGQAGRPGAGAAGGSSSTASLWRLRGAGPGPRTVLERVGEQGGSCCGPRGPVASRLGPGAWADHTQGSWSRGRGGWAHGGRPGPPAERPGGRSCHSPRWGLGGAGPCLRLAGGPGWVGGGRRVADPRAAGYTWAPRALGRGTGVCSGHLCCQAEGRGPLHGQVASVNSPAHPMGPREQAAVPPG